MTMRASCLLATTALLLLEASPLRGQASSSSTPQRAGTGDTVHVFVNYVRADKRAQFEHFMRDMVHTALDRLARTDSTAARQLLACRSLYPARMNRDSTYTYVFLVDPMPAGAIYGFPRLLSVADNITPDSARALYRNLFVGSLARPQEQHVVIEAPW